MGTMQIPNLQKLGMANLHSIPGVEPVKQPLGVYTKLRERSLGKDTMTGHWEMMGLYITKPFITFTENGFPDELIKAFNLLSIADRIATMSPKCIKVN